MHADLWATGSARFSSSKEIGPGLIAVTVNLEWILLKLCVGSRLGEY